MKKYLCLALLFISSAAMAFSEAELVQMLQKPENVQGNFVQQRFLKSLVKPITTSGQFSLVKNKGLLWQMQKPFVRRLKVSSEGIQQWNGVSWVNSQKFGQSEQIALFLNLLTGDVSGLSQHFEIILTGTEKQWRLKLLPRTLIMKQIFQSIQLQGDHLVKEIELSEVQGDRTLIQFSQLKMNQPLVDFTQ